MSDYKKIYHRKAYFNQKLKVFSELRREKIQKAKERKQKFGDNWQTVNLNDFVNKFCPNPKKSYKLDKLYFTSKDGKIRIVADMAGEYCRLEDVLKYNSKKKKHFYLDINGKDPHNYTDAKGKQHGRNKSQVNEVTHFRILHLWEIK